MLFNSLQFLIFFCFVVGLYFWLPQRYRWMLLLAASYHFYMCWKIQYAALILFSTVVDYVTAIQMDNARTLTKKRMWLMASLISNLGLLTTFKYLDFWMGSLDTVFKAFNSPLDFPEYKFLLPVGISFYTFQSLSYTMDVYRGALKAERHFGIFALYVSFFPQLVAGPIERSTRLLPQFFEKHVIEYHRIADGVKRMAWGFFKKLVIADRVAEYVNTVYATPANFGGGQLALGTILFAFQIYCDFSAYSDIAIGSAKVMGYELMENFRRPYFAVSISEFWKRWHISLSTWFRDYLYIPLGGNRVSKARHYFNLLTVFILSGLWHGANWTFVIWGGMHGLFLVCSSLTTRLRLRLLNAAGLNRTPAFHQLLSMVFIFALATFAWIFFRAASVTDALLIIGKIVSPASWTLTSVPVIPIVEMWIALGGIVVLLCMDGLAEWKNFRTEFQSYPGGVRWLSYAALVGVILLFGYYSGQDFIYFQF